MPWPPRRRISSQVAPRRITVSARSRRPSDQYGLLVGELPHLVDAHHSELLDPGPGGLVGLPRVGLGDHSLTGPELAHVDQASHPLRQLVEEVVAVPLA